MSERDTLIADFLASSGWADAQRHPFPGDASTRAYTRLVQGDKSAILMNAPAQAEAPACPPEATPQQRAALGYNALARLAGPNLSAFVGLSEALTSRGFSAPRILAANLSAGLLLLEDLGDDLFASAIPKGAPEKELYTNAVEALAAIYRSSFPVDMSAHGGHWTVMDYDTPALLAETELLLDWYVERHLGRSVDVSLRANWREVWARAFVVLETHAPGLALRDYHAENLIWLPDRDGVAKTGLIDYQDALFVHPAYDLVSLLEDARRDVPEDLAEEMKQHFFQKAHLQDQEAFNTAYALLGAQRNAKILGIFIRLAVRDGKPKYLDFLPRVTRHFLTDISHPDLSEVRHLIKTVLPEILDLESA